jgi:hypothetical protein
MTPRKQRLVRLATVALVVGALFVPTAHHRAIADHYIQDPVTFGEPDCGGHPDRTVAVGSATDVGTQVPVEVLVLLDRVADRGYAEAVVEKAAGAFRPLGLALVPHFVEADLEGDFTPDLFEQARSLAGQLDGRSYDAVMVATGLDVRSKFGNDTGGPYCIGGVRRRAELEAVAISEIGYGQRRFPRLSRETHLRHDAIVFAHGLGHVFGARHEHGNCAEGSAPSDSSHREEGARLCTVMDQSLGWTDLRFGSLETNIIRGHALRYAR